MGKIRVLVQKGHVAPREPGFLGGTGAKGEQEVVSVIGDRLYNALDADPRFECRLIPGAIPADVKSGAYRVDAFISLHCDGSTDPKRKGWGVGYPKGAVNKKLADLIGARVDAIHPSAQLRDNYTANMSGYYGWSRVPTPGPEVLVEHGFSSSPEEKAWMLANAGELARAHYLALLDYFGLKELPVKRWPLPLPKWFWPWARWRLGREEYKRFGPAKGPRPRSAPARIPDWAWRRLSWLQREIEPQPQPKPEPEPQKPQQPHPVFRLNAGFLDPFEAVLGYTAERYGYVKGLGIGALYVKVHHAADKNPHATRAWVAAWQELGVKVVGWGWLEGNPEREAELAAECIRELGLDGYIGNAETAYEGPVVERFEKSRRFCRRFRQLVPSPFALGVSFIGFGSPHRFFDWAPWSQAGAALLPQAYDNARALNVEDTLSMCDRAHLPRTLLNVSLGAIYNPPADPARAKAALNGIPWNLWIIGSGDGAAVPDDYIKALR